MPHDNITSFDLRVEPWIRVRFIDGRLGEVSLTDALMRAHEIRGIVGEVPPQVFAIVRLLLAVLYAAFPQPAKPVAAWRSLWQAETLPGSEITGYLGHPDRSSRFDLLSADAPFFQVAGLTTAKGEFSGLEKLIADVPNGEPYFTTRRGAGVQSLEFAEAARWLVYSHAFDVSGIKSGALGDDRVKGGKGYPIGTGWAGELGGVLVEGDSLKETLLLNLVLDAELRPQSSATDLPAWDREPLTAAVEGDGSRHPRGQAELFTWQSRRIRLAHDGRRVTGVLIANGDPLRPQNLHKLETMTAWRRSQTQEKKLGEKLVYMPKTHDPQRSLWRGIEGLLPNLMIEKSAGEGSPVLAPRSLEWLAKLAEGGALPFDHVIRTRAIGISYGTQSSVIDEITDDALSIHLLMLESRGAHLAVSARDMVATTEEAVRAVANLAGELAAAAGGDAPGAQASAREAAYFAVDSKFRRWLSTLDSASDVEREEVAWQRTAYDLLVEQGNLLVRDAGTAAWIGRERRQGGHTSSPEAYEWFRRRLNTVLPAARNAAAQTRDEQQQQDEKA